MNRAIWLTLLNVAIVVGLAAQESWTVQNSGTSGNIWSVKAVSPTVAWLCANVDHVRRTTDGGITWLSAVGTGLDTAVGHAVEALDANTAFVSREPLDGTSIYRTTNGGATWTQVFYQAGGFINAIRMYDATNGIAHGDPVGGKWTILRTSDGGASWARIPTEPNRIGDETGWVNSLTVVGTSHIWFGTNQRRIYRSTNGGVDWDSISTYSDDTYSMWFSDTQNGVGAFESGLFRTTDGGLTWLPSMTTRAYFAASGSGMLDCWAIDHTNVHRSIDCGQTWTTSYVGGASEYLSHIDFVTSGNTITGWAVGDAGRVLKYTGTVTEVGTPYSGLPGSIRLEQNYPNPFNPATVFEFSTVEFGHVSLVIYDLLGREVAKLVDEVKPAGKHSVKWDGAALSSGVYLYRLKACRLVETRKLTLLR